MTVKDLSIKHEGTQIILPVINGKEMTYEEACTWLHRKKEEEELRVSINHTIECSPLDGLVAFHRALAEKYGWVESVPTPGFFGPKPPQMISIPVGENEVIQAALGRIEIPGIAGHLETHITDTGFIIGGQIKQVHKSQVAEIAELTKKFLKEKSIYKGKAIKVSFKWKQDGEGYNPISDAPKFMALSEVKDDDLIFGEKVLNDINIGLFTPIEQSAACRKFGVPLKRGTLLYGPYGTGKTMTAYVTALKAQRHGWTFIYLESVKDLKDGLEFAAKYAPAVIFAEDIDRVVTGERSLGMDEILNTLDGVDTKGAEIITVFTTNHIELINPALLRMGRLDTLVEVTPPDAKAAERLVKLYSRGLLSKEANLTRIGKALAGNIPAFIREVTERSKIAAIARTGGEDIMGKVEESDLLKAASAMKTHADMLKPRKEEDNAAVEMFVKVPANHKEGSAIIKKLKAV